MRINQCKTIDFPRIVDARGNLTFVENNVHIPFPMQRVWYIYDVPGGSQRGGHAHKELQQVLIAVSGSFDVSLDDGVNKKIVTLNRSFIGLHICPMIWSEIDNFSSGSVCLVLASLPYDEQDYYRNYNDFLRAKQIEKTNDCIIS